MTYTLYRHCHGEGGCSIFSYLYMMLGNVSEVRRLEFLIGYSYMFPRLPPWGISGVFARSPSMSLLVIKKGKPCIDIAHIFLLYLTLAASLMGRRDPVHCPSRASYPVHETIHPTWLPFLGWGMNNGQLGFEMFNTAGVPVWFTMCFLASSGIIVWSVWICERAR